ncbi:MAG TPA: 4-hydroxythreonine-4-phosphate dehydrogenase PdxA [Alphaproteobacteria bacterium]|nr:4-hydroxythreonine-4-phosphate dehydrogenase PdxA [Alphaproteobacteria bacterium]
MSAAPAAPFQPLPLAVTMGEPAGIGAEITLKAWQRLRGGPETFFLLDDIARVRDTAARLGITVDVAEIASPAEAKHVFDRALPIINRPLSQSVVPGRPDPANAPAVLASIREAVELTLDGSAAAVVTNPIHKAVLMAAGFRHPGHTEFLGELCGLNEPPLMMLANPMLRVVLVTVHEPLKAAIAAITTARIVRVARIAAAALRRDLGIESPRIAVAGLNPHAGEEDRLGTEDRAVVAPAIAQLKAEGIAAEGPFPPDTMFAAHARARYDIAVCLYHDQGLIPLKTLDFAHGVDVTLGLPIVRTSPDHGTAFDIAGRGTADPSSMVAAIEMAAEMAARRAKTPARA